MRTVRFCAYYLSGNHEEHEEHEEARSEHEDMHENEHKSIEGTTSEGTKHARMFAP